jgi:spore maturation protein CgeB
MPGPLSIVILGLSITSSWGNGHATPYRALVRALAARGHSLLFLERDKPWYADNRDLPLPPYGRTELYDSLEELQDRFATDVSRADLAIVGSFVPDGIAVGRWAVKTARGLTAFYDIDTPITLARLQRGDLDYLSADLIPQYNIYLSFTGGPTLDRLERDYGSPMARALYCSVDPEHYYPETGEPTWDLGYLGTYSDDRQPALDRLLTEPARAWPEGRFVVAGPQYPATLNWPPNVRRIEHLSPAEHRLFYNAQRFTLNITRADMKQAGWSPSVRLFEAAACATPILSDWWPGLDELFEPGRDILPAHDSAAVLESLRFMSDGERRRLGERARRRILDQHTADHRAMELEAYVAVARRNRSGAVRAG